MSGTSEPGKRSTAYRAGIAVALVASFAIVWTTIVRDDDTGIGFSLVIMAAGVGGFAAWFRPDGMMRKMVGVAIVQALFGVAMVTAASTGDVPGGVFRALVSNTVFTLLRLLAANFFRVAASRAQLDGQ